MSDPQRHSTIYTTPDDWSDPVDNGTDHAREVWSRMARRDWEGARYSARRWTRSMNLGLVILGVVLLVVGIPMLILPGPGLLVLAAGAGCIASGLGLGKRSSTG